MASVTGFAEDQCQLGSHFLIRKVSLVALITLINGKVGEKGGRNSPFSQIFVVTLNRNLKTE